MIGYAVDVQTSELTKVLKRLLRLDKGASEVVYFRWLPGELTISLGLSSHEVAATGKEWPHLVSASSDLVRSLTTAPFKAAITDLRITEGKLSARSLKVPCTVHEDEVVSAQMVKRRTRS
jgi:hypothetical protein